MVWFAVAAGLFLSAGSSAAEVPQQKEFTPMDWPVHEVPHAAELVEDVDAHEITLTNGLISRTFRTAPHFATVDYRNMMTDTALIRAVKPEASVTLNGERFPIGGLTGQPVLNYLDPAWIDDMEGIPNALRFAGHRTNPIRERFPWHRKRYAPDTAWPPAGIELVVDFVAPESAGPRYDGLVVSIHYEMYQGLPLLAKWLTVQSDSAETVVIDAIETEILALVESESQSGSDTGRREPLAWRPPWRLHVESDYTFSGDFRTGNVTTHWEVDPDYETIINYDRVQPSLLVSRLPIGPDEHLAPGDSFESYRTFELVHDSDDRERQGLALRRMYRTLAPWALENPILMHVRQSDAETVKNAVDQCAEVGFEMVILSFGSGVDLEDDSPENIAQLKELADYAHAKGIELGAYSLLASRKISPEHDVIDPETGKPGGAYFENSPCLCSAWGEAYFRKLTTVIEQAGLDILEHDGSYPGDTCASTSHPHHRGFADSQWKQWGKIRDFYHWCRANGVYLNVPDWYFLQGSNKTAMGYRETNWSLPRDWQVVIGRQNIYDGTWEKTPSMGWMFVPLVEYHGGGDAATLEPLSEHLDTYEWHLAQNFGAGVQACYRGPRLYDTDATKAVVKKWGDFYKAHRAILDSDVVHVRRADGRSVDCMLHVNPKLKERGLALVSNPCDSEQRTALTLPLYYTGLSETASIREKDGPSQAYPLDREYNVELPVHMPPKSVTWFIIE